jgi:hypothetical protein
MNHNSKQGNPPLQQVHLLLHSNFSLHNAHVASWLHYWHCVGFHDGESLGFDKVYFSVVKLVLIVYDSIVFCCRRLFEKEKQKMTNTKIPILELYNGVEIPALGFGTYAKEGIKGATHKAVITALDTGYRHLDCAW